ncbi:MAG: hypothetical protein K6A39_03225 [Clostridiales bacterium]|nr:hypothetical protein [Clostridiales bacterium]
MKLWSKCIKSNKTVLTQVQDFDLAPVYDTETWNGILAEVCRSFDISRPLVMDKNLRELKEFGITVFKKADFIDDFRYDKLELEIIREKKKKF